MMYSGGTHIITIILSSAFIGLSVDFVILIEAEDVGVTSAVGVDRFIGIVMEGMAMDVEELAGCSIF